MSLKARAPAKSTGLLSLGLLLAALGASAAAAPPKPEPPTGFLERAKQLLHGNFLLWPDLKSLRERSWSAEATSTRLDSKERPLERRYSVQIRYDPYEDEAERRIYREGRFVQAQTSRFSGLWAEQWCPESNQRCTEMRDQIWAATRFTFAGEDEADGRRRLLFDFETAPPSEKRFPLAVRSCNAAGRAWFDASDLTLVKVEGEYVREVFLTKGFLVGTAKIARGVRWTWESHRTPEGAWLPAFREETRPAGKFPAGFGLERDSVLFQSRETSKP